MIGEWVARLGDGVLALVRAVAARSSNPSLNIAARRARELEEQLAAAQAEIERLRARLDDAAVTPTLLEQIRAGERARRGRRLLIARGGDRRYERSRTDRQGAY